MSNISELCLNLSFDKNKKYRKMSTSKCLYGCINVREGNGRDWTSFHFYLTLFVNGVLLIHLAFPCFNNNLAITGVQGINGFPPILITYTIKLILSDKYFVIRQVVRISNLWTTRESDFISTMIIKLTCILHLTFPQFYLIIYDRAMVWCVNHWYHNLTIVGRISPAWVWWT